MALSRELQKSLRQQTPRLAAPQVRKAMKSAFMKKKNEMIRDFLNHPVTVEIRGGVDADNISGTLGGITNLFSFIGFESGDDPIQPIVDLLESTNLSIGQIFAGNMKFSVQLPDAKDIFEATPLPYMPGRSWAQSIERGLSGLGYYLKKSSDSSRSGLGIQTRTKVRAAKFNNTRYISHFLKTYRKEFENLEI